MAGRKFVVMVLAAVALPAAAQTLGVSFGSHAPLCLSIGSASYRLATNVFAADLTVRTDADALAPDLRIAFAETADQADFIFVDDGHAPTACAASAKTVRVDAAANKPSVVVAFAGADERADYRIFVRSRWLAPETAAALFAAAHAPARLATRLADR